MARQQQNQANTIFKDTQGTFGTGQSNANALYGQLLPQFTAEATNPQGFGAPTVAGMKTNAEQSVGGSTAGAIGQGNLEAARHRNSGGESAALDQAVREGGETLSGADLGIDTENAMLKENQKQAGLSGLSSLYGTNTNQMLSSLGLGTGAVNAGTQAGNSGWFQNLTNFMNAAADVGKAGAAIAGNSG